MTDTVDLSALLSKPASDVVPPKPLPDGIYLFQIESHTAKVAGQNNNTVMEFTCVALQALDVSVEEGELPKKRRLSFWLTPDALYRLKDFMVNTLGISEGGKTLLEMVPEMQGRMFKGMITQSAYTPKGKTESVIVDNITDTYPAD